ncbi:MAG TPA: 23S rRNA (uracil(1939)-C(5))-methyltransferase RlmD [Woeseiaceae bacterium]|nr:23S rRNA (uracil(1939)-C(5))-methyltransferase RlmD [Woeseiaceae bacterium]
MARKRPEAEIGEIISVTHDGRGIVAGEGKKVFVAGALAGERVQFLRRKRKRNFDEAELLEVLDASKDRVQPKCAVFGRCGGCALQHISHERQLEIKFQSLKDALLRIGKVAPESWLEPITGQTWNYRRRARLAVKDVPAKGRVLVGFRERHAPFVTDMQRCEVLAEPMDALIAALSELIGTLSIRARLPQIEVAVADNATALVFRVLDPPSGADRTRLETFSRQHDVEVWLQAGGLDSLELLDIGLPREKLHYALPDFDVEIEFSPVDFVQINAAVNRHMVAAAIDLLDPQPGDRVLDLYCGIGNFSLPLARRASEVLGLEGEPVLVERARQNAERNKLPNAKFGVADLSAVNGSEDWMRRTWDRVLLDPARDGAAQLVTQMRKLDPGRIVYVSCHPGTLARDAAVLVNELGYRLESAGIMDMFPHTAHVESMAIFSRKNK